MLGLVATAFDSGLCALDFARNRLLKACVPVSGTLAGRRELRVAVVGTVLVALSLLASVAMPLVSLALGPIVLGVPHLVADLRYCVVRTGWSRRPELWAGVGVPLLATALGAPLAVGLAALAGACVAARAPARRRGLGLLVTLALMAVASLQSHASALVLLHVHNFVAVLLWWRWAPRRTRLHWIPLGVFALANLALVFGVFDGAWLGAGFGAELAWSGAQWQHSLAPGLPPALAGRLVLAYAFAQSVHYTIWLRLVPEDDRDRPSPRTFRASWRALQADLGPLVLSVAFLGAFGLAMWAVFDLTHAHAGYFRFAQFHVLLELCVLATLLVEGRGHVHAASRPDPVSSYRRKQRP